MIKKREEGFIQGLTKKQMETLLRRRVKKCFKSISIDGSGFDSTQFAELMEA